MGKEPKSGADSALKKDKHQRADTKSSRSKPHLEDITAPLKTGKQSQAGAGVPLHPLISRENAELVIFTCFVMWVGCTYQKFMFLVYSTEQWHLFDHLVKVMMNFFNYHDVERSLTRNLIFNTLRCMPEEVIMFVIYGTVEEAPLLWFRLVSIWVLTVVVQFCFNRRAARRNPNAWSCLMIFYITSFGIQFTRALSHCEQETNGELARIITLQFLLIVAYLQGDMIEDLVFGDLGRWGGIWHNWNFFMPPYTTIMLAYL